MKIVVTGGAGFIGSHLVNRYIAEGHEVIVIDDLSTGILEQVHPQAKFFPISLSDGNLYDLLYREKPDLINHHAAQVNVRKSVSDPFFDLKVNLYCTIQLLEAAGRAQVKRFIFVSSGGAVYGDSSQEPIKETNDCRPISPYGINKLAAEKYVSYMADKYGFHWTILRYSNVYGARQNPQGESGVISIFVDRISKGFPPVIFGDGEQIRDYVHVSDIVSANMIFSRKDSAKNNVYNVGTGIGTSLNDLLKILAKYFPAVPPVYEKAKSGDLSWNILSNEKLNKLGWIPKISLEEGIKQLIQN